jgi:hypothetical protein
LTRNNDAPGKTRGTVNAYWIERRERRLAARKPMRKRTSKKEFDKPIDLWDKVI